MGQVGVRARRGRQGRGDGEEAALGLALVGEELAVGRRDGAQGGGDGGGCGRGGDRTRRGGARGRERRVVQIGDEGQGRRPRQADRGERRGQERRQGDRWHVGGQLERVAGPLVRGFTGERAVQGVEVDGDAGRGELGRGVPQGVEAVAAGLVEGQREVGALAQDLVDPPAAQPARAELEEDADAVGVGALDHGGEVEGADRLAVQGLLGARRGRGVGGGGGGGVEARPGDRGGRAVMQRAPGVPGLGELGGVGDDRVAERAGGGAGQAGEDAAAGVGVTPDHAVGRRVDDQQVSLRLAGEGVADLGERGAEAPALPRSCGQVCPPPRALGGVEAAAQLAAEQRLVAGLDQHAGDVGPGAVGEQGVGLARRVADRGVGAQAEVVLHDAGVELAEERAGPQLVHRGRGGGGRREGPGGEVLEARDGAPQGVALAREGEQGGAAHAGVGRGRAGVDKRELAGVAVAEVEAGGEGGDRGGRERGRQGGEGLVAAGGEGVGVRREDGEADGAGAGRAAGEQGGAQRGEVGRGEQGEARGGRGDRQRRDVGGLGERERGWRAAEHVDLDDGATGPLGQPGPGAARAGQGATLQAQGRRDDAEQAGGGV